MSDCRPENLRDIVDPYVAEALYDETIAWNIDMRGGGSVLEWPSWEELPDMAREHWMSMAVTARVASRAALESSEPADLIAVVRAGVESGTIKGDLYDTRTGEGWRGLGKYRMTEHQGPVLVIPVSDGGEDRP